MPVAYAVTYIFGTIGSAIVLALIGPALLGIDLEAACKRYEEKHGDKKDAGGPGTAWHHSNCGAFRVNERGLLSEKLRAKPSAASGPARVCTTYPPGRADPGSVRRRYNPRGR